MAFHLKKHAALSVNLSEFCSVFPEIECRCHCGILLFLNGLVKRSNRPHKISSLNITCNKSKHNKWMPLHHPKCFTSLKLTLCAESILHAALKNKLNQAKLKWEMP